MCQRLLLPGGPLWALGTESVSAGSCVSYGLRAVATGTDTDARASPGHRAESSGPRGSWYLVWRTCAHSQGGPQAQAAAGSPHVSTGVTEHAGWALPGCPALSCAAGRGQATTVHMLQSCRRRGAAGSRPRVDLWGLEGRALAVEGRSGFLPQMKRGPRPPQLGLCRSPGPMAASGPQSPPLQPPALRGPHHLGRGCLG